MKKIMGIAMVAAFALSAAIVCEAGIVTDLSTVVGNNETETIDLTAASSTAWGYATSGDITSPTFFNTKSGTTAPTITRTSTASFNNADPQDYGWRFTFDDGTSPTTGTGVASDGVLSSKLEPGETLTLTFSGIVTPQTQTLTLYLGTYVDNSVKSGAAITVNLDSTLTGGVADERSSISKLIGTNGVESAGTYTIDFSSATETDLVIDLNIDPATTTQPRSLAVAGYTENFQAVVATNTFQVTPQFFNRSSQEVLIEWTSGYDPGTTTVSIVTDVPLGVQSGDAASGNVTATLSAANGDTTFTLQFIQNDVVIEERELVVPLKLNVLMIVVDDLNDWVGFLGGHTNTITPNMDALASEGMSFENAYCQAPVCNPSRTSFLSGLYPWTSRVYANGEDDTSTLTENVTISHHFKNNGYYTAGAGKVRHWANLLDQNWSKTYLAWYKYSAHAGSSLSEEGKPGDPYLKWGPLSGDEADLGDHLSVDDIVAELGQAHDTKPFFLACGIFRPHLPWFVPQENFDNILSGNGLTNVSELTLPEILDDNSDGYDDSLDGLSDVAKAMAWKDGFDQNDPSPSVNGSDHQVLLQNGLWHSGVQAYLACINYADEKVGELMTTLENGDFAETTVVILFSDHGWSLGEKQSWRKQSLWQRSTHVPFLVRAPGVTTPGSSSSEPVGLIDVFPTLSSLCGLPDLEHWDGNNITPLLEDPSATGADYVLTTWLKGSHAVRSKYFRYIRYWNGGEELYDHRVDPNEWNNLAGDPAYEEIKTAHRNALPDHLSDDAVRSMQIDPDTGTADLTWNSFHGVNYVIQGRPDLRSNNWQAISGIILGADNQPTTAAQGAFPADSDSYFFRVSVESYR